MVGFWPMHYVPMVDSKGEFELELLKSEEAGILDGWILKEPAPQLPNLQGIPIVIVVGEASYHQGFDHLTSYVLNPCGVKHDFVRLQDVGIHGNGHMMMLEKNHLEIADWILGWLKEHVN